MQHTHQATAGPRGAVSFFLLLNQVPRIWDSRSKAAEEFPVHSSHWNCSFPSAYHFTVFLHTFSSERCWQSFPLRPHTATTAEDGSFLSHLKWHQLTRALKLTRFTFLTPCFPSNNTIATQKHYWLDKRNPPKGTSPQSQEHCPNLNATPPALSQTNTNHS